MGKNFMNRSQEEGRTPIDSAADSAHFVWLWEIFHVTCAKKIECSIPNAKRYNIGFCGYRIIGNIHVIINVMVIVLLLESLFIGT